MIVLAAFIWFLIISYITSQTEYQRMIADTLADPYGTSILIESILNFVIVTVAFIPSGFLLAYMYVKRNFNTHRRLRITLLSLILAATLYVPFGWYNFLMNF